MAAWKLVSRSRDLYDQYTTCSDSGSAIEITPKRCCLEMGCKFRMNMKDLEIHQINKRDFLMSNANLHLSWTAIII